MEALLSFLEHQCGAKVPGKPYRMSDRSRDNDHALLNLRISLGDLCCGIQDYEKALAHALEAHEMLLTKTNKLDDIEIKYLHATEMLLADAYLMTGNFPKAQYYTEKKLALARRCCCENHTNHLYHILNNLSGIMGKQRLYDEALVLAREAYELVSGAYGPEHPDVQDAANGLIEYLMKSGDFAQTEDFARMNYETLMSGANTETVVCALAMKQLANLWTRKPIDLNEDPEVGEEAAHLANKAFGIIFVKLKFKGVPDHLNSFLDAIKEVSEKRGLITKERYKNSDLVG